MDFFPLGVGFTSFFCWALLSKSRHIARMAAFEAAIATHRQVCADAGNCAPNCPLIAVSVQCFTDLLHSAVRLAEALPPLSCNTTLQQESGKAAAAGLLEECTRGLQCLPSRAFAQVQAGVSPVVGFYEPKLKLLETAETEGSLHFLLNRVLLPNDAVKLGAPNGTFTEADSPKTGPIPATPRS